METPKPEGPEGPFAEQVEWMNHRLDPGYYLGGRVRPELRSSLGHGGKRVAAVLAFVSGIILLTFAAFVSFWYDAPYPYPSAFTSHLVRYLHRDPYTFATGALSLIAGWRLWKTANEGDAPGSVLEGLGLLFRIAGTAALGAAVFLLVAAAVLTLVALPSMAFHGRVDILAGLGIAAILLLNRASSRRPDTSRPRCPVHREETLALLRALGQSDAEAEHDAFLDRALADVLGRPAHVPRPAESLDQLEVEMALEGDLLDRGERPRALLAARDASVARLLLRDTAGRSTWDPETIWLRSLRSIVDERVRVQRLPCSCEPPLEAMER